MANKHRGSSLESFLEEEGILAETEALAVKRVIAYQLEQEMKKAQMTKVQLAAKMSTSRAALARLLDPTNTAVSLKTLVKMSNALGKHLVVSVQS